MEYGEVFVEMDGIRQMLILSVNNWAWGKEVRTTAFKLVTHLIIKCV